MPAPASVQLIGQITVHAGRQRSNSPKGDTHDTRRGRGSLQLLAGQLGR